MLGGRCPKLGKRAVAALFDSHIHDHRARPHRLDHLLGNECGRLAPRDQGRRDHNVSTRHPLSHLCRLASHPPLGHGPRIAPHPLGNLALLFRLKGHINKLGPQGLDLLFDRGPHI